MSSTRISVGWFALLAAVGTVLIVIGIFATEAIWPDLAGTWAGYAIPGALTGVCLGALASLILKRTQQK